MKRIVEFGHSGTNETAVSERELRNRVIARRSAAEGIVLLKNEGLLPLKQQAKVALFGSGAVCTVKGGTGSGDVNEREAVSIRQGMENAGYDIVNRDWLDDYEARYQAARLRWRDEIWGDGSEERLKDFFQIYTTNPFYMPDGRPLREAEMPGLRLADCAIYVISRNAGEGFDRRLAPGDYYLTERENEDIHFLNDNEIPTILIVNAGAPVELTETAELAFVKSVLFIAQAGQEGGNAVADIISGRVNPSGKLTATWAREYSDYPNAESFSYLSGDVSKEYYTEGIYVGYRYFDTFNVKPLYGFGYGLSYTTFSLSAVKVDLSQSSACRVELNAGRTEDASGADAAAASGADAAAGQTSTSPVDAIAPDIHVTASITNVGDKAGKETLQVYVSCPRGRLPKERRRLAAFGKTALLQPEASEKLELEIPLKQLASFDEKAAAWILEAGEYIVWVGNCIEHAVPCGVVEVDTEIVVERAAHICPLKEELHEIVAPKISKPDTAGLHRVKLVCEAVPETASELEAGKKAAGTAAGADTAAAAEAKRLGTGIAIDEAETGRDDSAYGRADVTAGEAEAEAGRADVKAGEVEAEAGRTEAEVEITEAQAGRIDAKAGDTVRMTELPDSLTGRIITGNSGSYRRDEKLIRETKVQDRVHEDEIDLEARKLARLLPAKDMIPLLMGEISRGQGALGAAGIRVPGSAGETSSAYIKSFGLAGAVMADGPAGLRLTKCYEADPKTGEVFDPGFLAAVERGLFVQPEKHPGAEDYYQFCTAFPVGVLLAQSFDKKLVEEVGKAVAEELHEFHVSWWLAPGLNIQRNPLCGRNFEYYSEDPLVSGVMAAAMTDGVQSQPGVGTTIKHLACNNQEDNRIGSDSVISERALREIYLRGFEIAVKESQPMCIMSSYNLINGVHAANNYDLCTVAAREEWGFLGVIMSDWTTTLPEAGSIPHLCVKAGNDLIMPGMQSDYDEIVEAYEAGKLSDDEIRACAERLINVILRTSAYEDAAPYRR